MKNIKAKIDEPFEPNTDDFYGDELPVVLASLHMWGQAFSPKAFAEAMDFPSLGISFTESNEPGEICVAGPDRGKPDTRYGYGGGIISPPPDVDPRRHLWWIQENVLWHRSKTWRRGRLGGRKTERLYLTGHFRLGEIPTIIFPHYLFHFANYDLELVVSSFQWDEPRDAFAM